MLKIVSSELHENFLLLNQMSNMAWTTPLTQAEESGPQNLTATQMLLVKLQFNIWKIRETRIWFVSRMRGSVLLSSQVGYTWSRQLV